MLMPVGERGEVGFAILNMLEKEGFLGKVTLRSHTVSSESSTHSLIEGTGDLSSVGKWREQKMTLI